MFFCGIGDEAGAAVSEQIAALKELGWSELEARNLPGGNWHSVNDREFAAAADALEAAGLRICCFASEVANWARDPFKEEDFEASKAMLATALRRMRRFDTQLLRGMSFKWQLDRSPDDAETARAVFAKVKELVAMCEDAGVIYLHENCMNYGGQSYEHTLRLLDAVTSPALQLVFDTGNPVFAPDRMRPEPCPRQSSWEFYSEVKSQVRHIHIKDGVWRREADEVEFTWPGEGEGDVRRIVADLKASGYDGGISIEPHLAHVFHTAESPDPAAARKIFVEYGRRVEALWNCMLA